MSVLALAKIYCLRAVVTSCVASLVLFVPLNKDLVQLKRWDPDFVGFALKDWLSFGLSAFTLIHHLLMSLNMDFIGGLVDLPLLLFEITGVGFHIARLSQLMLQFPTYIPSILPTPTVHTSVSCILLVCLSLEVVLRIGSFLSIIRSPLDGHRYSPMLDHTLPESLTAYQIIFGHSIRRSQFSGNAPTARVLGGSYLIVKMFLLRVVLVSSAISLALSPLLWFYLFLADYLWLAVLLLVILHHLLSCINFQFEYAFVDLPFLIFEIAAITPQFNSRLEWVHGDPSASSNPTMIGYVFFSWLAFVGLVLETLVCAGYLITYLIYRIRRVRDSASVASDFTTKRVVPKPQHVLFGNSLWKRQVIGETWIMILSRGVLVIMSIFLLSAYSAFEIVISPIQEKAAIPVNDIRVADGRMRIESTPLIPAIWNVVFVHQATSYTNIPNMTEWDSLFQSAVNVKQLSDSGFGWLDAWGLAGQSAPISELACTYAPGFSYPVEPLLYFYSNGTPTGVYIPPLFQVSTMFCGSSPGDFLITVNFTTLQIPTGKTNNLTLNSLQIMIGLDDDSYKVIQRTPGTTLIPGTNLFGTFTWEYRQVLKTPSLSTFGLFDSYDTIMVSRMLSVIPDPVDSPTIPRSPDIATFRLFMPYDISELRTIQDYRTSSVLGGFSAAGGLWAFLSGIFGMIFGISRFQILFGGKPISFLGLAHFLQRKEIKTEWKKKYREIEVQVRESGFEGSLLSLLLDEVVDLDFLELEWKRSDSIMLEDTNEGSNESMILQDRNQVSR